MDKPGTSKQAQNGVTTEDLSNSYIKFIHEKINNIFKEIKRAIEECKLDTFKNLVNILHTVNDKSLIQQYIDSNDYDIFSLIGQYSRADMLEYLLDHSQILPYLSPIDKAKRNNNILTTFSTCMINHNTILLEKFYDLWAGDLHWAFNKTSSINDNENLYNLCILLNAAKTNFQEHLKSHSCDPQIIAEVHCILTYNEFQIQLYEKLNEVKSKIADWKEVSEQENTKREIEAIKEIIGIIIDLHELYTKGEIFKEMNIPRVDDKDISLNWEATLFYMYKTFFWKIDYNLCILVLDNLYLLKTRLRLQKNFYQNLESMLYRFIYHCKSDWSFYLSKTELYETDIISTKNNGDIFVYETSCTLDVGGMMRYFIMYLEQKHFIQTLRSFKEELMKPITEQDIRAKDEKLSDEEIQPLLQFPEMRDDFSLKKMWRYLQELPSVHDIKNNKEWAHLLLERILQIVGEFLKSTKETMNLEPTTQALIMAEVPIDVVKSLNEMRNILCKQKDIRILWRMEIAKHGDVIMEKLLQDLLYLRDAIKKVININRYLVNRSLAHFGFKILHERNDYIIDNIGIPDYLYRCYSQYLGGLCYHVYKNILWDVFYKDKWSVHGLSKHLMTEVGQIRYDFDMLSKKCHQELKRIQIFLDKNYFHYKEIIEHLLEQVIFQLNNWTQIKSTLQKIDIDIDLSDYPNHKDLNGLQIYLNENSIQNLELNDLLLRVTDIDLLWDLIERLFEFLIKKTKCFDDCIAELKFNLFTHQYRSLCEEKYTTDDVKRKVEILLNLIKDNCAPKVQNSTLYNNHQFDGIKEYAMLLNIKQFVTEEEVRYIVTNSPNSENNNKYISNFDIENSFFTDMDRNVKTISKMVPFDKVSEKIIRNVTALDRDPELLKCFYKRICLLSSIIDRQPKDLLVARYKYDAQFRIWLEMILIDLLNISQKCKIKETLQKQNKLLTEINIRNVLAHGSPLLEGIGNVLDANDLPGEIIHKSLQYIDAMNSIEALVQLQKNDFPFTKLYSSEDCDGINEDDKILLQTFKELNNWRSYLFLIPEYKDYTTMMTKNWLEKKKLEKLELIEAAKNEDYIDDINELLKRVDINESDDHGNAALHYAAWNGKVAILEDLIKNKANIDIQNTVNKMTALHYAALKGHTAAIEFLENSGAKILTDKNGDTYKDIEVRQSEAAKKRLEEREMEVEFEADDFKLFDLDD